MYNKCFGLSLTVSTFLLSRLSYHFLYSLLIVFSPNDCILVLDPFLQPLPSISFSLIFVHVLLLSFIPTFLPSLLHSFSMSQISIYTDMWHWFFILPFPTSKPALLFPTLCSLSHSLPVHRSSFLHLSFFPHISWYCCCVPNVPQTLFSIIKLLSLPSPAAARITWAEQALLNIEQHREGGTQEERHRVKGKERKEGRKREEKDEEGKAGRKRAMGRIRRTERKRRWEKRQLQYHSKTLIYLWSLNRCHWQQGRIESWPWVMTLLKTWYLFHGQCAQVKIVGGFNTQILVFDDRK